MGILKTLLPVLAGTAGFAALGPGGAAAAAAAVTAGQGGDLEDTLTAAGIAGAGGIAGNAIGGKDLFAPGIEGGLSGLFSSAPQAASNALPSAGQSIGSFDVLGAPTAQAQSPLLTDIGRELRPNPVPLAAPGFTNIPETPTASPPFFSRENIPAITNVANTGLNAVALARQPQQQQRLRVPALASRPPAPQAPFPRVQFQRRGALG